MNTHGETEARNVQARELLTAEERRSFHPEYSVDRSNPAIMSEITTGTPYGYRGATGKIYKFDAPIKSAAIKLPDGTISQDVITTKL